ncbi:MAG: sugar phosphate isomerase/epimerase family protein [Phycisphaerales bacterium]
MPMPNPDNNRISRRTALGAIGVSMLAGCSLGSQPTTARRTRPIPDPTDPGRFRVSLAEWSLHKLLFANEIDNLDFPREAASMGFGAVEYVNAFFKDKATDDAYLKRLDTRCTDAGVESLLIMVDGEGRLGAPTAKERTAAADSHERWLHAAAALGCHSIRVNASGEGDWDEWQKHAADGLRALCERAERFNINVIVENHGGPTSNGEWLAGMIKRTDHPLAGTLPDFGNFCYDWSKSDDPEQWYDRYQGVRDLMPYAKAVSAKSYDFDDAGNETTIDFARMLRIVADSNYRGWIGVEFEGSRLDPREGSRRTKALLEREIAKLG